MSEWITRLEEHAIHETLKQLLTLLQTCEATKSDDAAVFESLERLKQVTAFIEYSISAVDPMLLSVVTLTQINQTIQKQVIGELTQYSQNGTAQHLHNANKNYDNVIPLAAQLPTTKTIDDIDAIRDSLTGFRKSVGIQLHHAEKGATEILAKQEDARAALDELKNQISEQHKRLNDSIAQYQKQFSDAEAARGADLLEAQGERQDTYAEARGELQKQQQAFLDEARVEFDAFQEERDKKLGALIDEHTKKTKAQLEDMGKQRDTVQEIVNVTSMTGMAGGYKSEADDASTRSRTWQRLAICLMIGFILLALYVVYEVGSDVTFTWPKLSARIFAALAFSLPAAYAAKVAKEYHEVAMRNRRQQLELSSIDGFLLDIPKDVRDKVKEELAARMFGQSDRQKAVSSKATKGNMQDVGQMAAEIAVELFKKHQG